MNGGSIRPVWGPDWLKFYPPNPIFVNEIDIIDFSRAKLLLSPFGPHVADRELKAPKPLQPTYIAHSGNVKSNS